MVSSQLQHVIPIWQVFAFTQKFQGPVSGGLGTRSLILNPAKIFFALLYFSSSIAIVREWISCLFLTDQHLISGARARS
jgi:hypothetical protein